VRFSWEAGLFGFVKHAFKRDNEEPPDPVAIREALGELLGGRGPVINIVDVDVDRSILVFRAVDVPDDEAEAAMRGVIDKICKWPKTKDLRILETFRLVGLVRE